jgi:ribosome biogenesis GTPase / thiamine phosphate phosphatase
VKNQYSYGVFDLNDVGWDERWASLFARHAPPDTVPARVTIEFNHIYRVMTADGELQAQLSGRLRHQAAGRHELAAVGDWVAVRRTPGEQSGTIDVILPRRSKFSRKVAGDLTEEQVVAANIDTVFLVMGLDRDYNPRRLERYLLTSHESGARPVVLLSKADLAEDVPVRVAEIQALAPGVPVHATIAVRRELPNGSLLEPDVEVVEQYLGPGRTGAMLGSSGAGKSTMINALVGMPLLETREVRAGDSRGRHTTRHRQMIVLPGRGVMIDTPGMRELQLWDVSDGAKDSFEEIDDLAASCHFTDCRHRDEPRCAVKAAVADGSLAAERLASYLKLQDELRELDARRDVRAQIEEKRRGKIIARSIKQLYKQRERD